MFSLLSTYLHGPINDLGPHFEIDLEQFKGKSSIRFIGDTYAGKSLAIKSLVFSLGGLYTENLVLKSRTQTDYSLIFAERQTSGERTAEFIELRSHAGHDISSYDNSNPDFCIGVIKNLKGSYVKKQLGIIAHLLEREKIDISSSSALVTRIKDFDELSTLRMKLVKKAGFKKAYAVDNRRRNYSLQTTPVVNFEIITDALREKDKSYRLIYFGNEEIPENLEDRVVRFDNHFSVSMLTPEDVERTNHDENKIIIGKKYF